VATKDTPWISESPLSDFRKIKPILLSAPEEAGILLVFNSEHF
jgi:hypothetical protein